MTLSGVAQRCAEESDRFFHRRDHDPRFCFELFRRAIEERDEGAWSLLCDQYRPLVAGWVKRNEAFAGSKESVSFFVNGAFAKMWSEVTPEKFVGFDDLKSLLRYLQLCVASVITDHVRTVDYHERLEDLPRAVEEVTGIHVEQRALDQAERESFWQAIDRHLAECPHCAEEVGAADQSMAQGAVYNAVISNAVGIGDPTFAAGVINVSGTLP